MQPRPATVSVLLALALLAPPLHAEGRQLWFGTIGFLGPSPFAGGPGPAFQQALRALGYEDGRNLRVEYRYTDLALRGHPDLLPELVAELLRMKPEVLVVSSTEAALAAKAATRRIPIVLLGIPKPVAARLVASLARPGGNVTGLTRETRGLVGKSLRLLKATLPETTCIGVLVNPTDPRKAAMLAEVRNAAKMLGLELTVVEAGPTELEGAFATLHAKDVGAVLVLGGGDFSLNRTEIVSLTLDNRLPSMFQNRGFVEAGGLLSYAPSPVADCQRTAVFVDRILKGINPADLPVEQPAKFELVINLRTAKALGLRIPHSILLRADEVIQ